eukprot:CAMPEP_0113525830 /NCGR_PEP_ID=MMETSP0015_2-20120614/397_1 /TAXON_ID=2838 /ORGANISM="Odontella" /LENGTH=88 /DNA_ID=CAMNT_0000424075 /DNA_START=334 /DNA_END=596 /DNA_ORIENTATION=+ /assembly_acc=CAM_ASM_000160
MDVGFCSAAPVVSIWLERVLRSIHITIPDAPSRRVLYHPSSLHLLDSTAASKPSAETGAEGVDPRGRLIVKDTGAASPTAASRSASSR